MNDRSYSFPTIASLGALFGCLALVAWVQRHALGAFFSSPDDLVHLQQAVGLKPTLPTPLRFLSQVLYFRAMVRLVGLEPVPYHLVSLVTHLLVVVALIGFLTDARFPGRVALIAGTLFGMMPLHITLLSSAVGMNDELALLLTIAAMWLAHRGRAAWAASVYALALFCKESVLCFPVLLLMLRREGESLPSRIRRAAPLMGVALVFGLMIVVLRPYGLASGGPVYAMRVGSNVFHNLATYTAWAVEMRDPMPDLVSSFSTTAWHTAGWVLGILGIASWRFPRQRFAILFGLAWWVVGLIPVLPLRFQTYRHYLYPALPGLALAVSAALVSTIDAVVAWIVRLERPRPALVGTVLAACLVGYAARADSLIAARLSARVAGTALPLDPVMRRREVAERAIGSMAQELGPAHVRVAILTPRGTSAVFGARSGRPYSGPAGPGYDLLRESLDDGGAVRLFFPQVDSVAFIQDWRPVQNEALFLHYPGGYLVGGAKGSAGLDEVAVGMLRAGWYAQAESLLATAVSAYPEEFPLRLALAGALFKRGEREAARAQLRELIRVAPSQDSSAVHARWILDSMRDSP